MKKRAFTLSFSVLLASFSGMSAALAQITAAQAMLAPIAPQADPACGKATTVDNPSVPFPCGAAGDAFLAVGNGTTTTMVVTNPTKSLVEIHVGFNPQAGMDGPYNGNCPMYMSWFGGPATAVYGFASTISPGTSVVFSLPYPGQNNDEFLTPAPLPDEFLVATMTIAFFGPDAETLSHQTVSEVIMTSGADNGGLPLRADVPFVFELDAAAAWTPSFSEISSPENTVLTAINISPQSQKVAISFSINGVVKTFTTPDALGPNALYEGTLAEVFPGVSPPHGDAISFTFEGLGGGLIIPEILQASRIFPTRFHVGDPRLLPHNPRQ